jgi:histidine ammonia-lyase
LQPHALAGARGLVGATGKLAPKPDLNTLIAGNGDNRRGTRRAPARRAA